jgi:hypothetical protein
MTGHTCGYKVGLFKNTVSSRGIGNNDGKHMRLSGYSRILSSVIMKGHIHKIKWLFKNTVSCTGIGNNDGTYT